MDTLVSRLIVRWWARVVEAGLLQRVGQSPGQYQGPVF